MEKMVPYESVSQKNRERINDNTKARLIKNMENVVRDIDVLFVDKDQGFVLPYSPHDEYVNAREFFEKHYGLEKTFWIKLKHVFKYLQEKIESLG